MSNKISDIVIFRFEASKEIGLKHALRCKVLIDVLQTRGWHCIVIASTETYRYIEWLSKYKCLEPSDYYNKPICCELFVVDFVDTDESYENFLRQFARKTLVIEDSPIKRHNCDFLLDQTFGRNPNDYADLVPKYCVVLAGSNYVLVGAEFTKTRPLILHERNKKEKSTGNDFAEHTQSVLSKSIFVSKPLVHEFDEEFIVNVDGFGVNRILYTILYCDQFQRINFSPVRREHKEMIFKWQQIKEVRQYCVTVQSPTWDEHNAWFEKRLKQFHNPYWLINRENVHVGVLSLTFQESNGGYELGWLIIPQHQGKRLGTDALRLSCFLTYPLIIHAFVKEDNIASNKSMLNAGFTSAGNNLYHFDRVTNGE
jgi:RimJ/RimL family protein N-acetyltransferase